MFRYSGVSGPPITRWDPGQLLSIGSGTTRTFLVATALYREWHNTDFSCGYCPLSGVAQHELFLWPLLSIESGTTRTFLVATALYREWHNTNFSCGHCLFCLFGFLTSSSTTRLYRGRAPRQERLTILRAATHETELGDHDFCLSRSHYTDTDPTCRERAATAGIEPGTSSPGVARSTAELPRPLVATALYREWHNTNFSCGYCSLSRVAQHELFLWLLLSIESGTT